MSRRLLDKNILSEIIKGKNTAIAAKAATYLSQQGQFTTSAVTVAEMVYGFRRMGREVRVAVAAFFFGRFPSLLRALA
jgi:tRNA(fMet)-specific endonuclease VapC